MGFQGSAVDRSTVPSFSAASAGDFRAHSHCSILPPHPPPPLSLFSSPTLPQLPFPPPPPLSLLLNAWRCPPRPIYAGSIAPRSPLRREGGSPGTRCMIIRKRKEHLRKGDKVTMSQQKLLCSSVWYQWSIWRWEAAWIWMDHRTERKMV